MKQIMVPEMRIIIRKIEVIAVTKAQWILYRKFGVWI